jgi:hypothetical protein
MQRDLERGSTANQQVASRDGLDAPLARGDQSVHVERGKEGGDTGHCDHEQPAGDPEEPARARGGCSGI